MWVCMEACAVAEVTGCDGVGGAGGGRWRRPGSKIIIINAPLVGGVVGCGGWVHGRGGVPKTDYMPRTHNCRNYNLRVPG